MKVFISWSGDRSKAVASALSKWLPDVFQDLEPWMSAHDIGAGQRWGNELGDQLGTTNFGVLCLTPENLQAPWLLFEAGAISKIVGQARVVPYLFQLSTTDVPFPLAQFQGAQTTAAGTLKLVQSINAKLDKPLPFDRLERLFAKWWPDLQKALEAVSVENTLIQEPKRRSERALLEEILETVRNVSRLGMVVPPAPPSTKTEPDPDDYWRGVAVWNVSANDMEALSIMDLNEYVEQAKLAYQYADPDPKSMAIKTKIELAQGELRRKLAQAKAATNINPLSAQPSSE